MLLRRHKESRTEEPIVEPSVEPIKFEGMTVDQLKVYAEEHGIDIGSSTSVNGIIKKIKAATEK